MPSFNPGAACTGLWWVRPTDLPNQRGYSWGMNWGTIIFVLVAVAQGYAKWRKKQADEAKRSQATASKKKAVRQPEWREIQVNQSAPAVDSANTSSEDGSPWIPGDRDPERGGERLLAQARNNQATAGLGLPGGAELPSETVAGGASAAQGPASSSRELDMDLILKGFGLDTGASTISSNARIEDLEDELNMLRQRQSTLLRNWKKLRDERDTLAMRLEGAGPAPGASQGPVSSQGLLDRLKSPSGAREAFVVAEILSLPVGSKRSGAQSLHN